MTDGDTFYLNVYLRANSTKSDTTVKLSVSKEAKTTQDVFVKITSSGTSPAPADRSDVLLTSDSLFYLEPVENEAALLYEYGTTAKDINTASLHHDARSCTELDDFGQLFNSDGFTIKSEQRPNDKSLVLSLKVRAIFFQQFTLETKARKAKDDQEIDVTVTYKNNGNVKQRNVSLNSLATIDLMETVPGSVVLTSPGYPDGTPP